MMTARASGRARRWLWLIPGLLLLAVAAFVAWGLTPLGPSAEARAALGSDSRVRVNPTSDGYEFTPASGEPTTGVIFYPGGHVDARSYALWASDVAAKGYLVVIPVMPLSLAVLSPSAANDVIAAHPRITRWIIGGHSLGGSMAAQYANAHRDRITGLVLLASYPPGSVDLSDSTMPVVSALGTQDTVINRKNWNASRALLPAATSFVSIRGGNHAQFGSYGPQPGDTVRPVATPELQRAAAVDATLLVLHANGKR